MSALARDSMWGPTFPELVEALPGVKIIDRSSVNVYDDPRVAGAIEGTGRKKLTGLSLEVCAAFPATPSARASMHTSPWMRAARSVRPSGR